MDVPPTCHGSIALICLTKRCYARTDTVVSAAVSGGSSKDAGGDGYGGDNDKPPASGGGATMSIYRGVVSLERNGGTNASRGRALDIAMLNSAVGRSYTGGGGIFAAASRMCSSERVDGSAPSRAASTPRRRVSPRAISPLALLYIQSPKKVSPMPVPWRGWTC